MTTCKKCGTPLDPKIKVCPICQTSNPMEKVETTPGLDLTENYNPVGQEFELVRLKSRKVAVLLSSIIGFTGAPFFYLGYLKKGLVMMGLCVLMLAVSVIGYFLISPFVLLIGIVMVLLVQLWTAYFIGSQSDFKDGRGELLK